MLLSPLVGSGGRRSESCASGGKVDLVNFTLERSDTQIQVDGLEVNSLFYRTESLKTAVALGAIAFIFVCRS